MNEKQLDLLNNNDKASFCYKAVFLKDFLPETCINDKSTLKKLIDLELLTSFKAVSRHSRQ